VVPLRVPAGYGSFRLSLERARREAFVGRAGRHELRLTRASDMGCVPLAMGMQTVTVYLLCGFAQEIAIRAGFRAT
jgi:hypothetical protein